MQTEVGRAIFIFNTLPDKIFNENSHFTALRRNSKSSTLNIFGVIDSRTKVKVWFPNG